MAQAMIQLSPTWLKQVEANAFPGMDYHIVSIVLRDGRRFDEVVIDQGYITKIAGREDIAFSEPDISEIISPYDKWLRLPTEWLRKAAEMPEHGMGYVFVSMQLHDGRSYDALINSGFITRVKGFADIPFSADDIKTIVVGKRFD